MTCEVCNSRMQAQVDITGSNRCDCEEYCYCSGPDVSVSFYCSNAKCKTRRRPQRYVKPVGLRDQDGIARWFTENYKSE